MQELHLQEKLGKQEFHCRTEELFEPITKALTDASKEMVKETKKTTKAIGVLHKTNYSFFCVFTFSFSSKNY